MNPIVKSLFFSILLISTIVVASQQEKVHSFYDATTNTEWVSGKQHFSKLVIDAATKNYVFCGELSSDSDIDVQAKNLIILGTFVATRNMQLKTSHDFFNGGHIEANNVNIEAGQNLYNGLSDKTIAKIQALGINIRFSNAEHTSYTIG